jgi:phosphatidylglycerophosphatase A
MKFAAKTIATFFGVGFIPLAPGTVASAAALALYKWWFHRLPLPFFLALIAIVFLVGTWASSAAAPAFGRKDPRTIVIDEVAGQMTALILCPVDWIPLLIGFGLFRFFDILKPFPIRRFEKLPGGWGIMADDMAAGVLSFVLLRLYLILK